MSLALRLTAVVSSMLVAACGRKSEGPYLGTTERLGRPSTTLTINNGFEPASLDPGLAADGPSYTIVAELFEGLTAYHPVDLHPVQAVAERWDLSPNGLLYRFHLRRDARWSDGRPVVAADFVYAWRRLLRPSTASQAAGLLYPVRNAEAFNLGRLSDEAAVGVRALDDATLEVELEQPTPYFLDLTSSPNLSPVRRDVIEPFEQRGERERWTRPESIVTNGPFTLESWRLRYAITIKRNPFYWAGAGISVERVVWLEVESAFTALNLYQTGQLDLFGSNVSYPRDYGPQLERLADHHRFPQLVTYWLQLNVRRPPLDDARVRRALNLAIDKKLLTETVARGGIPTTHYVPDSTGFGYAEQGAAERAAGRDPFSGPELDFDPQRARALLREAGYAVEGEGESFRAAGFPAVEMLYNGDDDGTRKLMVAIQDMWRRHLGISPALRGAEWKVLLADKRSGHFQIAAGSWGLYYSHPHAILDTFVSTSPDNATGWASAGFDDALHAAAATVEPGQSMHLYRLAERAVLEGMPRIPLYFFTGTSLVKPYVRGYYDNARDIHPLQYVWIDPQWQQSDTNRLAYAPRDFPPPGSIGRGP
jgi:oligopeptide transport system substrate-binding protein